MGEEYQRLEVNGMPINPCSRQLAAIASQISIFHLAMSWGDTIQVTAALAAKPHVILRCHNNSFLQKEPRPTWCFKTLSVTEKFPWTHSKVIPLHFLLLSSLLGELFPKNNPAHLIISLHIQSPKLLFRLCSDFVPLNHSELLMPEPPARRLYPALPPVLKGQYQNSPA